MAVPSTPTGLAVAVTASNLVKLTWNNVTGETGYYVYRSTDDVTYVKLAAVSADVLEYEDDSVDFSTQYYYKVSAYNNEGESSLSSSVTTNTLAQNLKKYWIGNRGPYYYDANAVYNGEDISVVGFRSEGSLIAGLTPTRDDEVLRNVDIDNVILADGSKAFTGNVKLGSNWLSNDGDSEGLQIDAQGNLSFSSGVSFNVTRITSSASPYSILSTDFFVICNTDSGAVTLNLSAGSSGKTFRIANSGSSSNNVVINANGSEKVRGSSSITLTDGEVTMLVYNSLDGWW